MALCASCANPELKSQVRNLHKQLDALSQKNNDALHKQEELEGRVFLLTDQLEAQKAQKPPPAPLRRSLPPDLPVVALRPQAPPKEFLRTEEEVPVEFTGPAHSDQPDRVRPLLRAQGDYYAEATPQSVVPAGRPGRTRAQPTAEGRVPGDDKPGDGRVEQIVLSQPRKKLPRSTGQPQVSVPPGGDNLGVVPLPGLPRGGSVLARAQVAERRLPAASPARQPPPAGEPLVLYGIAREHIRAGQFAEAENDLKEFIRRFPRHEYADNAQYWLGETYYARKNYDEAAAAFRGVVERFPTGNKVADALLKLGYTLLLQGQTDKGQEVLKQVLSNYPQSNAARLAGTRLAEIGKK